MRNISLCLFPLQSSSTSHQKRFYLCGNSNDMVTHFELDVDNTTDVWNQTSFSHWLICWNMWPW